MGSLEDLRSRLGPSTPSWLVLQIRYKGDDSKVAEFRKGAPPTGPAANPPIAPLVTRLSTRPVSRARGRAV